MTASRARYWLTDLGFRLYYSMGSALSGLLELFMVFLKHLRFVRLDFFDACIPWTLIKPATVADSQQESWSSMG